eukprot:TRINITY_DN4427_c0_g5_i1.p1 TRINITY_DN4427_c0_g5~~TRINITY_DN4427_c0_g5_i1.p1  ORF type:complete len:192 (+),score=41.92 TRINITY_DN4427_c0_g5_i1:48-578(+)
MALPTAEQLRSILEGDGYERVSDAYIRGLEMSYWEHYHRQQSLMKQQEESSVDEESEPPVRKEKVQKSYIRRARHSPRELTGGVKKTDVVRKYLKQKKAWDARQQESNKARQSAVWDTRYRMLSAGTTIYHHTDPVASYCERTSYQQTQPLLDEKLYNKDRRSLRWAKRCSLLDDK